MPLDPEIQKMMHQQRMSNWINGLAQGFMKMGQGGEHPVAGALRAIGGASAGGGGQIDGLRMQMQMEQLADNRAKRAREEKRQTALSAIAGGLDPATGIDWNTGRPGFSRTPEGAKMVAQAFPEEYAKSLFPGSMKASDLVEINTPEGPKLVPASEALGKTPYDKPPAPDRSLVKVYDEATGRTSWAPRAQAVGMTPPPPASLMQITGYDEDGRPLIQVGGRGGGAPLEKKTKGDLEERLLNTTDALARLDNIATSFKPEYQTLATRGEDWFANFKEKTGLGQVSPEDRALMEDYTIYQSTGLDNINRTIKDMTGAQMSAAEAKRIRAAAPDPGEGVWPKQGPTKFVAQVKRVNRDLRAAQARYAYALNRGLPTDPESLSKQIPLDQMEVIIQERAEEIEASLPPGVDPSEAMGIVAARVAREFGLPFRGP